MRWPKPSWLACLAPRRRHAPAALLAPCALVLLALAPAAGQAQPPAGTRIEQAERPTVQGPKAAMLGGGERASVILFFRPGQEHSRETLKMMAECERELAGKPIHWAAVVSGSAPADEVRALVKEVGLQAPVLIDEGDTLYAALRIILHPVVILADQEHRLFAFVPFRKINYCIEVRAWLQRLLGEIDQAALERTLNPEVAEIGGEKSKAERQLGMARKRLEAQSWDKAIESARKALEHDPKRAAAHALIARALAGKGDCAAAAAELQQALALDPKDEEAAAAQQACAGK